MSQTNNSQNLGVLLYRHTMSRQNHFGLVFLMAILAIILFIAPILLLSSTDNLNILAWLYSVPMSLTAFIIVAAPLIFHLRCKLYLYEFGATEQFGIWCYSARYEDIKIWHSFVGFSGVPKTWNSHYYSVEFPKSSRHGMYYFEGRYNETAMRLMELVCKAQLPNFIADFNAGQSIDFDGIIINQSSLKTDSKTFLWSEGYHLELAHKVFIIVKYGTFGKEAFARIEYDKIPNVFTFIGLLQHINKLPN